MSEIKFLSEPTGISVQAYRVSDGPKVKCVKIEEAMAGLATQGFSIAEWLDLDWPNLPNAHLTIARNGSYVHQESILPNVDCDDKAAYLKWMREEIWLNEPIRGASLVMISDGWARFFCTLFDAVRYLLEKSDRSIAIKILSPGISEEHLPQITVTNMGDDLKIHLRQPA